MSVTVSPPYAQRIDRARQVMAERGVDALLLSVGSDLPYLTGYHAMPLERLTMLVVQRDEPARLVIPRLEAPRVQPQPGVFELLPWNETDDPVGIVAQYTKAVDAFRYRSSRASCRTWHYGSC